MTSPRNKRRITAADARAVAAVQLPDIIDESIASASRAGRFFVVVCGVVPNLSWAFVDDLRARGFSVVVEGKDIRVEWGSP